jgi:hypothetical protein
MTQSQPQPRHSDYGSGSVQPTTDQPTDAIASIAAAALTEDELDELDRLESSYACEHEYEVIGRIETMTDRYGRRFRPSSLEEC